MGFKPCSSRLLHQRSLAIGWIGLQPGLETGVHSLERPVDRFRFLVLVRYIFSLSQNVGPAPLEVTGEGWIRCPPVTDDSSVEVLATGSYTWSGWRSVQSSAETTLSLRSRRSR